MQEPAVLIAGGGPTGLMLAGELALAGVAVAIVERRATQDLDGSRAGGLHARTLEVLDQRGIVERFVAAGQRHPAASFNMIPLDVGDLPTRHNYVLALWQQQIERLLAEWVDELGVPIQREGEVVGFVQDSDGVQVQLSDGSTRRAQYLVGCDGGRSAIRTSAGIEFAGWEPTTSWLIAEVATTVEPQWGFRSDASGTHGIGRSDDGARARIVLTEAELRREREPTLQDVREALVRVYGTDFGSHDPRWISRFTDATRQAVRYRDRRVLLAGDAAHVHPPVGGQGLNLGVQDAVNLGWKLAQVVRGVSAETLLDTYHAERHPVAARVLRNTMAQVALRRTDERTRALGEFVAEVLTADEPRRRVAAELTGLAVRYELGTGHPLLGRRMPDLDVVVEGEQRRVFELLHDGRALLLSFGGHLPRDVGRLPERVRRIDASRGGPWELPALGAVEAPAAVLVRPDGYVAWAGTAHERDDADAMRVALQTALHAWCGVS